MTLFGRVLPDRDEVLEVMLATGERCLQPDGSPHSPAAGNHAQRTPGPNRLLSTLHRMLAGVLVGDRRLAGAPGRVVDEHVPRCSDPLDARGGIDGIAEHHALPLASHLHGREAGHDAGAGPKLRQADVLAERGNRPGHGKPGTHRPLGVVLASDGRPPHRHERIADELLDSSAEVLDQRPGSIEVSAEQLADVLRVTVLGVSREPDQIGEEHGDESPLRDSSRGWSRPPLAGAGACGERGTTRAAEAVARFVLGAAARAEQAELGAALRTEAAPRAVLQTAGPAPHRVTRSPARTWERSDGVVDEDLLVVQFEPMLAPRKDAAQGPYAHPTPGAIVGQARGGGGPPRAFDSG